MRYLLIVLLLLPVATQASPVASLHRGLDAAYQLLNIVRSKFFFLSSQVNSLQQGIRNLRQAPIKDNQIARLEPYINRMTWKAQQAVSNPGIFDRLGVQSLSAVEQLNTLTGIDCAECRAECRAESYSGTFKECYLKLENRRILPANRNEFAAKFRRQGPYNMIWQAISHINAITSTLGI